MALYFYHFYVLFKTIALKFQQNYITNIIKNLNKNEQHLRKVFWNRDDVKKYCNQKLKMYLSVLIVLFALHSPLRMSFIKWVL